MRINLLPPEIRERQRIRRQTVVVALVGLIVLVVLGGFYFLQQLRLNQVEDDLAVQEAENEALRQDIAELERFDQLEQEVLRTETLLASLLENEVLWSGVLRDVSLVIPGTTWLTNFAGTVNQPGVAAENGEAATAGPVGGLIGQITMDGFAFDHRSVALWLTRLEEVDGFVNPWLTNSQKTEIGTREAVQFSSSVDLSPEALARQEGSP